MNKLITVLILFTVLISLSSCYKLWTCTCYITQYDSSMAFNNQAAEPSLYSETTDLGSKREMKEDCDRQKWIMQSTAGIETAECTLK